MATFGEIGLLLFLPSGHTASDSTNHNDDLLGFCRWRQRSILSTRTSSNHVWLLRRFRKTKLHRKYGNVSFHSWQNIFFVVLVPAPSITFYWNTSSQKNQSRIWGQKLFGANKIKPNYSWRNKIRPSIGLWSFQGLDYSKVFNILLWVSKGKNSIKSISFSGWIFDSFWLPPRLFGLLPGVHVHIHRLSQ